MNHNVPQYIYNFHLVGHKTFKYELAIAQPTELYIASWSF